MKMHDTVESLYKYVPKECLPEEYLPDDYTGPNAGSIKSLGSKYTIVIKFTTWKKHLYKALDYRFSFGIMLIHILHVICIFILSYFFIIFDAIHSISMLCTYFIYVQLVCHFCDIYVWWFLLSYVFAFIICAIYLLSVLCKFNFCTIALVFSIKISIDFIISFGSLL